LDGVVTKTYLFAVRLASRLAGAGFGQTSTTAYRFVELRAIARTAASRRREATFGRLPPFGRAHGMSAVALAFVVERTEVAVEGPAGDGVAYALAREH
jgi:hypothetical protein